MKWLNVLRRAIKKINWYNLRSREIRVRESESKIPFFGILEKQGKVKSRLKCIL